MKKVLFIKITINKNVKIINEVVIVVRFNLIWNKGGFGPWLMLIYMDLNHSKQSNVLINNFNLRKKDLEISSLNKEIEEQKAINWVLGEVIKISSNLNSFVGLMETVTDMLMGVMGLDTCTIWLKSIKGFKCYSRSIYNENQFVSQDSSDIPEFFMRIKEAGVFDLNNSEYRFIRGKNVKSILLVPLENFKNKTRIGIIVAEHHSKEYFSKSKIDFFQALAIQISIASENAKLFEEERKKSENEINEKNQLIIENINYASIIQNSLLPDISFIKNYTADAFAIWKPRDIVGGDIYWFIPLEKGFCIAVIDCTGHGVSGAFMTIAVNQILNQMFKECEIHSAAEILNKLNNTFKDTFYKFNNVEHFHAGLDIGICIVDRTVRKLTYSGARMSLFYCTEGHLKEIRGVNKSIGYNTRKNKKNREFTDIVLDYLPGDTFYITTDGFIDQNGQNDVYPFGVDNFMRSIQSTNANSFQQKKNEIWGELVRYMGGQEQRDDITLIGIKLE